ncbi:hypothetical protein SERLA73DRAFT_90445 [Serpula lacrymans var. lacrymans S7.3]|uniref:Carboxylic ester hydrolase n=1 Tax=Serpula lacrymans var. lacrymans (strain S7.3) TaxID=936435 RepID=F8PZ65_SERL3|nr:hypothetical protein SERLA73DRAFT_90445 [Serpula lacrymans var. lacrymans S7.3]
MLNKVGFLALLCTLFPKGYSTPVASASGPTVDLGYAQYQGSVNTTTDITSFLGIRYAAAPFGDLRFEAPQSPPIVSGVQQAIAEPNECIQGPNSVGSTNPLANISKREVSQSEDCLFLNVYLPGSLPAQPIGDLPVIVWIHGGGYIQGAASAFDGADIIRDADYGVVVVLIQYRLGLFVGFLSGTAVKENGALNAGLLDQTFALQWVQDHISGFGGDPERVTIWGESAGAGSVYQHIVANQGNTQPPLFRAAMTSSTFMPSQFYYNDPYVEDIYNEVVSQANCSSSANQLSCLRNASTDTLITVNNNVAADAFYGTYVLAPVVDGTFIVERPTVTLGKGLKNGDVLFSVTNTFEGREFVDSGLTMNITEYLAQLYPRLNAEQIAEAAYLYSYLETSLDQAIGVMGETIIICPTYFLQEAFAGQGWKGEFALPPGNHGQDIPYYFTSYPPGPSYDNTQFITSFSQSFMSIVRDLNPNAKFDPSNTTPPWTMWNQGNSEMLFNVTETGTPEIRTYTTDEALLERCAYWRSVSEYIGQ